MGMSFLIERYLAVESLYQVCYGAYLHEGGSNWSWRAPSLVQAFAPLTQVVLVWFIPESPRYLVSKGMVSNTVQLKSCKV